jgi:signal transduction histidine kinase
MIIDLVEAKEKAEESDRLKTAFLANVSHEIRTPMNGIMGFLELLRTPGLADEQKEKFVDVVNVSGERLLSTINDLVEISKIQLGQVEAQYFVKDTGIGILPDRIGSVFDRFVQADLNMTRPYEGTGLGLSIVKGYIELLKGQIWIESKAGKGSTFFFSIPYQPVK